MILLGGLHHGECGGDSPGAHQEGRARPKNRCKLAGPPDLKGGNLRGS